MALRQLRLRIVQAEISGTATELARERALDAQYRSTAAALEVFDEQWGQRFPVIPQAVAGRLGARLDAPLTGAAEPTRWWRSADR